MSGAAHSAAQIGDRGAATKHYGRLLTVCKHADPPGRAELVEARRFLASAATER